MLLGRSLKTRCKNMVGPEVVAKHQMKATEERDSKDGKPWNTKIY